MRESLAFLVYKQRAVVSDDELISLDGRPEDRAWRGWQAFLALGANGQSLAKPTISKCGDLGPIIIDLVLNTYAL